MWKIEFSPLQDHYHDTEWTVKKLHLAEDIVYITLAAVICGAGVWEDISGFGTAKEGFLKGTLSLKHGIPSPDTFNRFFAGLSPLFLRPTLLPGRKVFAAKTQGWLPSTEKQSGVPAKKGTSLRSTW